MESSQSSDEEGDLEDEMMLMVAIDLLLDEEEQTESRPRLLDLNTEERPFAAIYASENASLFRDHFRMSSDAFDELYTRCEAFFPSGLRDSREALAVTLDWLGSAPSCRKQEITFNISFSTIHKYRMAGLKAILQALESLMTMPTEVPRHFQEKFPYFDQALCAVDGAHVPIVVSTSEAPRFRNRKDWISTNVLVATDWDMRVCFAYVGAEGCAHDATVLQWSGLMSKIPEHFYVIADAGYALTDKVLTPFRSTRYHLKEWATQPNGRPQNARELFNLRHAKARNIVERVIGVLKRRFRILRSGIECEFDTSTSVIFACMLLHNFIRGFDSEDTARDLDRHARGGRRGEGTGADQAHDNNGADADAAAREPPIAFDFDDGNSWRAWMTNAMWEEYLTFRGEETADQSSDNSSDASSDADVERDDDMD